MTAKVYEFLNAPRWTEEELKKAEILKEEQIMALQPGAIRYDGVKVLSSPSDNLSERMNDVYELDKAIDTLKAELKMQKRRITEASRRWLPESSGDIIIMRYVVGYRWCDIAKRTKNAMRTVFKLHKSATDTLDEKLRNII